MISGEAANLEKYANQLPDTIYQCLRQMVQMNLAEKADGIYEVNGFRLSLFFRLRNRKNSENWKGTNSLSILPFLCRGKNTWESSRYAMLRKT